MYVLLLFLWLSYAPVLACPPSQQGQTILPATVVVAVGVWSVSQSDGFEYTRRVFPSDRTSQQAQLNEMGQQGWIGYFLWNNSLYYSRARGGTTKFEWKSWELPKWGSIDTLLAEAGTNNYDQCFVWNAKRLWCSRPLNE